jgi:pimeloyl-ACP methyl ester carboxylesterase
MGDMPQPYYQVGELDLPVLLIWGRHDHTIPVSAIDMLREAIPQAEFHVIEEAGHIPHYERPEIVNPILIDFLKRGVHE